jgi:hypothetical protein
LGSLVPREEYRSMTYESRRLKGEDTGIGEEELREWRRLHSGEINHL